MLAGFSFSGDLHMGFNLEGDFDGDLDGDLWPRRWRCDLCDFFEDSLMLGGDCEEGISKWRASFLGVVKSYVAML
jgi:hypothetical protein